MAHRGRLKRVFNNTSGSGKHYWSLVIDTEAKGEVKFNLWDSAYAEPPRDCHGWVEQEVLFDAMPGKVKNEATGECYPSTITVIQPVAAESEPVGELQHDEARDACYEAVLQHVNDAMRHLEAARQALGT